MLLVWKQLLQEANTRQLPVILITDDRKEDWVRREHGLTLGPRPELCEEMSAEAGVPFHLMSTATFLRHAKEYLSVSVSPETVDQARELPAHLDDRDGATLEEMHRDEMIVEIAARLQVIRGRVDFTANELRQVDDILERAYDPRTGVAVDGAVRDVVLARRSKMQGKLLALNNEADRLMAILGTLEGTYFRERGETLR